MRINHNIQALNAYRNLYSNQSATSKNLERLSSGLRINRAADDAAGLAISEKMRSQIRGLKQAERNSMDGISLMQTAEGAMTEVHSMLQRMRELAVQAANDTNTTNDREAIQREIDQLKLEIDSIASKTEFNTRKLLDGSSAVDTQFTANNTKLNNVPTVIDPSLETGDYRVKIDNSSIATKMNITQPGAGINDATVIASSLTELQAENLKLGEYSIVVTNVDTSSTTPSATIEVFDPDGFSLGKMASEIGTGATPSTITIGTGTSEIKIDNTKITQAGTAKITLEYEADFSVQKKDATGTYQDITFKKTITTEKGLINHGGLELLFGTGMAAGDSDFTITNKALAFQIGANTNQSVNIDIPQLSTVKLGIDEIDVLSHDSASDAIFLLDKAINQISSVRSKLGATQNRLEHTINNLQTTNENLTASESRIRDADMALEMTEFTKNNILNQSAQAMLAQANQLPQGVLQLLQG
ncbi:flagellin N-terminal helical domain-containing protein [Bacillus sp. Marseille-P3661]|uniref:flagellin N-terminal helical domain-containing protein n=1 Tax=Bacillus sp. Marseille-P3661 TaxID=1936234 RepID=UPI000C85BC84|nr:flagellin [Bacillus sp. Marseille-P3661]